MRRPYLLALLLIVCLAACHQGQTNAGAIVITHPDGRLYVGDQVSFEVLLPDLATGGLSLQVKEGENVIASGGFGPYGVGGRNEAVFWWVWNTRDLDPGRHTLIFTTLPEGPTWEETYTLHPGAQVPAPEPQAHWTSTTSDCCTIYYITGTDAERDIASLARIVDEQALEVENKFGRPFSSPVTINIMPRTLGHGGFASNAIYVSYLDRNYAGSSSTQVIQHELVHIMDAQLSGGYKPSILVEGLAVYITGGHFKQELLPPRAAALFELGGYIPLQELSDDFYPQQHEIGYLEAGALVQFLVEGYGWQAFDTFYRSLPDLGDQSPSQVLDSALQARFSLTLAALEQDYIAYLQEQTVTEAVREDLRLTIYFYNTVRRYQAGLDPSAHFMTAWLPDAAAMRQKGIVADLLRRPDDWKNRHIESLLVRADEELRAGNYLQTEKTLNRVNQLLNRWIP